MNEKHEIPYPCDTCEKKSKGGNCAYYKWCAPFINWFSQKWREIQKTYEGAKKS